MVKRVTNQKKAYLTDEEARRLETLKQRVGVTNRDVFNIGVSAISKNYSTGLDEYRRAADEAEKAVIAANERMRKADLDAYFQKLREYVGDVSFLKLKCETCGFKFETAKQTYSPVQLICPRCSGVVKVPAKTLK